MEITTPPLLCSTTGLRDRVGPPRAALTWIAAQRARHAALDTTDPALRPRNLDRPARRELAATLGRLELACGGVDLPIPAEHFESPGTVDRAVAAVLGAVGLLSELRSLGAASAEPIVCVAIGAGAGGDVLGALEDGAGREGVTIASLMGDRPAAAVDLAALARSGVDASRRIAELGGSLGCIRIDRFDRSTLAALGLAVPAASVASPGAVGLVDASEAPDSAAAWASAADVWNGPAV